MVKAEGRRGGRPSVTVEAKLKGDVVVHTGGRRFLLRCRDHVQANSGSHRSAFGANVDDSTDPLRWIIAQCIPEHLPVDFVQRQQLAVGKTQDRLLLSLPCLGIAQGHLLHSGNGQPKPTIAKSCPRQKLGFETFDQVILEKKSRQVQCRFSASSTTQRRNSCRKSSIFARMRPEVCGAQPISSCRWVTAPSTSASTFSSWRASSMAFRTS